MVDHRPSPLRAGGLLAAGLALLAQGTTALAAHPVGSQDQAKVFHQPIRSAGPGSMDPVRGSTVYDNQAVSMVYETLLQYSYLKRPLQLEPLLLEEMPKAEMRDDGMTYTFKLREGIRFQDDPCFEGGKGRELVAEDVFYSWKRMADEDNEPKSWWLYKDTIVGFDAYREAQNAAETFDYDAPVEGMRVIDDHTFQVVLKQPVMRFLYILAMFQTSVVPREAVEEYGTRFSRHPVGTGPFRMKEGDWVTSSSMTFTKNPTFADQFYPKEWMPEDEERGLHLDAGKKLPLVDKVEISFFVQDQPMWLEFESGNLDFAQIPAENYKEAINKRKKTLRPEFERRSITYVPVPLLDFIFRGFNMEDELLGGFSERATNLRRAFALAIDLDEFNDTFYEDQNIVYDGMIPPGLDGHPEDHSVDGAYRGPDLDRARRLLAEAGFPGGQGLPVIDYYTSLAANSQEQSEMMKRQLGEIGVRLNVRLLEFPQLIEAVNTKKAPFFSFAWSSDYPDGENNLALFYGPNESPGSNHFNYKNPEFDALYEKILTMRPSSERTEIYEKMRDMVLEDVPYVGSMARTRNYLIHPWLKNFKPTEDFYNWPKYLNVDVAARNEAN